MPAVGEQIRVTVPDGEPILGSLAALGGDTLMLSRPGDTAVRVRVSEQRVDVLRRRRETWSGLGALAGVAVGIGLAQLHRSPASEGRGVHEASQAVLGSAAGALTGGLIGFFVAPRRWQRLTVVPRRNLPAPGEPMPAEAAAPASSGAATAADPAASSADSAATTSPAPADSGTASPAPADSAAPAVSGTQPANPLPQPAVPPAPPSPPAPPPPPER